MLNVDIGGVKNIQKIDPKVRSKWKVLDIRLEADYVYDLNSQNPFPFQDNSVDNYYSSVTLESVFPGVLLFVLGEMRRTLKTGGKCRIVVPDIRVGIDLYLNNKLGKTDKGMSYPQAPNPNDYPSTMLGLLMPWFYTQDKKRKGGVYSTGHKMAFDWDTLHWYFRKSQFKNISKKSYQDCSNQFAGKDFRRYRGYGLYVEGEK